MSGTPTTASVIHARLTGDATLTTLLTGGIYTRPIKRSGDGATPNAFSTTPPYWVRPAAVVTDGTDEAMPLGPDAAFSSFPWVYLYGTRDDTGKNTIANAWDRMFSLLHNWRFATGRGTGARVTVIGRLGVIDDDEDSTRVVGGMRLQVTGLWRQTE
jgi:hypothetical protein